MKKLRRRGDRHNGHGKKCVLQENDVGYFGISPKKYYYGDRSIENPSKHDSLD